MLPNLASQMRTAFSSMACKYRLKIAGRAADNLRALPRSPSAAPTTRLVRVVRCCSASNSRVFSMAITAWSAKVSTNLICLSVNGRTAARCRTSTPTGMPSRRSGTPRIVRKSPSLAAFQSGIFRISEDIRNLNGFALKQDAAGYQVASQLNSHFLTLLRELAVGKRSCYER